MSIRGPDSSNGKLGKGGYYIPVLAVALLVQRKKSSLALFAAVVWLAP